ncbi:MAG TPA: HDIG domain-containing protein [Chloroflexi bacterium]|nr:HDIG domain-containing protein [Chloroflexota bacterium]
MKDKTLKPSLIRAAILTLVLILCMGGIWWLINWSLTGALSTVLVSEGSVASQDVMSPYAVTYQSQVLTEELQQEVAQGVDPIYTRQDSAIARQQLNYLKDALTFIDAVRNDQFATQEQKFTDLAALDGIYISQGTAEQLLELSDVRWQTVRQETVVILEQVMRTAIRVVDLEEARQQLPSLVSLSLSEDQVNLVVELASAFVAPNSVYSEEATEAARQEAIQGITSVTRSIVAGETIIRRGEIVHEEDIEALQEVGLLTTFSGWQNQAGTLAVVILCAVLIILYFRSHSYILRNTKKMIVLLVLFLAFLGLSRYVSPGHLIIPYLFPMAAYSLLVAALIDRRTALFTTIPLAILAAYGMPHTLDLTLYYSLGGLMGLLILRRPQRLSAYVSVAGIIAVSGSVILVAYRIIDPATDVTGLATLIAASIFYGVASAVLTILLEFALAPLLDLTTTLQLVELSRPDHPLLQRLLREIPGTYQHTLQVANLAEQAAERIQANSMLARVGALYHDIGKMKNPKFYIENQGPNQLNTHDDMAPEDSSEIIIDHVHYGLELAKKYRLPSRIREFIPEHHGTLITRYQYGKALEIANGDESQIDKSKFRYPGPRPQSVETALVMLADGCEAYVRSQNPETDDALRALIKDMVDRRVALGQLDNTELTLRDLKVIIDSFTTTLKGTYHARVDYPEDESSADSNQEISPDDATLVELRE